MVVSIDQLPPVSNAEHVCLYVQLAERTLGKTFTLS